MSKIGRIQVPSFPISVQILMCISQTLMLKKRKNKGVFLSEFYDVITGSWMTAGIGSALGKEARIS